MKLLILYKLICTRSTTINAILMDYKTNVLVVTSEVLSLKMHWLWAKSTYIQLGMISANLSFLFHSNGKSNLKYITRGNKTPPRITEDEPCSFN